MTTPSWLENKLSIGNIITVAVLIFGLVAGWNQFDTRLTLTEDRFSRQTQSDGLSRDRMERRLERIESDRDDMRTRIIRMEEQMKGQDVKLDSILREVQRPVPLRQ